MKTLPTITIGIPAYNEGVTLPRLLKDIERQQQSTFNIAQIIVVSDASTDDTVAAAQRAESLPIRVHQQTTRQGKAAALNYIFTHATTDIVIIFDADVRLAAHSMIQRLVQRMLQTNADLVGARVDYQKPTNFFQRILASSCDMKDLLFLQLNHGDTIYTCHGRARAFSRQLYSQLHIKSSINEDAYSYVFCKVRGLTYAYAPTATVLYRLPKSVSDHTKQALRFRASQVDTDFKQNRIARQAYKIPFTSFLRANIAVGARKPELILYYLMTAIISVMYLFSKPPSQSWDVSATSKL